VAVPARRIRHLPPRPRLVPVEDRSRSPRLSRRVSPRRRGRPRRSAPFVLFALVVTAVMVTILATAQALVAQGSFRLSELSRRAGELEARTSALRARVATLSVPGRIEAAARRQGLVVPERIELLVVREERG
jgi:cell division protein FtsB